MHFRHLFLEIIYDIRRDEILFNFQKREEKDEIEKLEFTPIMALMKVVLQVVISS